MLRQVHILQQGIQHTVRSEDRFPSISPYQITDPERDDHKLVKQVLLFPRIESKKICQWISQQKREDRHSRGNPHGTQKCLPVNVNAQKLEVIGQTPGMLNGLRR